MQRDSCQTTLVRQHRLAVKRAVIYSFATQRRPGFSQVNPHLMRPSRLQSALDQGVLSEVFDEPNVRHCTPAFALAGRTPAAAVAAVVY
jgi:hypothetical protein